MKYLVLLGRFLFSAIFVVAGFNHFSQGAITHAASQGVPMASLAVPFSGVLAIIGGLSIAFGYKARFGAVLIALFLIPVTFMMHKFWGLADPAAVQMQMSHFMKNLALLGGAFLIWYFGAGPLSMDARGTHFQPRRDVFEHKDRAA